jgi:hypothetical protein
MILIENNIGDTSIKVYDRIYWAEDNVLGSSYHFLSMRNTVVANYLIERIYHDINRE